MTQLIFVLPGIEWCYRIVLENVLLWKPIDTKYTELRTKRETDVVS